MWVGASFGWGLRTLNESVQWPVLPSYPCHCPCLLPFESLGSVVVHASPELTEEQGPLLGRSAPSFSSLV